MSVDLICAEPEDYVRKHVVVEEDRHKVIIWWSSCRHGVLVEAESCLEVEEANWQAGSLIYMIAEQLDAVFDAWKKEGKPFSPVDWKMLAYGYQKGCQKTRLILELAICRVKEQKVVVTNQSTGGSLLMVPKFDSGGPLVHLTFTFTRPLAHFHRPDNTSEPNILIGELTRSS
jgi:hypothetical protein